MNLDRAFNIAGSIVTLAIVAVVVGSPQTAKIINALGSAFSGAIRQAASAGKAA